MSSDELLQSAFGHYQQNQLDIAETKAAEFLESAPKHAKALQLRALIARKKGDLASAEDFIAQSVKVSPDAENLNTQANIFGDRGQYLRAVEAYRESLSLAPNYVNAAINLGQLFLQNQDPMDALGVFENGLRHNPQHPSLMRGKLFALKDSHQNKAALELLGQIPGAPELALTAGQILIADGPQSAAEKAFKAALTVPPTSAQALINLAQISWMRDGPEAAQTIIQSAITDHPDMGMLYIGGANLMMEMDDLAGAYKLLDACEQKFGPQPELDAQRASFKIEEAKAGEAFKLAEKALMQRPGDINAMQPLARAALMTEQFEAALEITKAAQTFMPNDQFWIAIEATALRGLGRDYKSLYDMERLIRIYDMDGPAKYDDITAFNQALKEALEALHDNQHHPLGQSLRLGTQTSADLRFAKNNVIQDFFKMLEHPIKNYMAEIGTDQSHPLTRRNTNDYRLTGAWSVRLAAGGHHVNHVHPEGWISSAYYVDVPDEVADENTKAGWIKFGEPPFAVPGMTPDRIVQPKAGRLVLFPSYMWHGTIPITGTDSRLTLPFDAVPA